MEERQVRVEQVGIERMEEEIPSKLNLLAGDSIGVRVKKLRAKAKLRWGEAGV